jgi:aryl-alcohol dehydrogenase-like predicted oxidoreductase
MRKPGRTGIDVSAYCLDTMVFGKLGNPDHDCVRMPHRALGAGVHFVGTTDVHGYGETEEILGKALKGRRDEVVPATTSNGPMGEDPNRSGSSRRWVVQAAEGSPKRLRTDCIDLYRIHHPGPHTDIEEPLSALTGLVRAGKVRAIGSSSLPASEIVETQWASQRRGLHRPRTEQPTYSVLNRGIEREVLPTCRRCGLGVPVRGPLATGLLTGRYRRGTPRPDNPRTHGAPGTSPTNASSMPSSNCSPSRRKPAPFAHLAMSFATSYPDVTSAIMGPRTMDQLDDLLVGASLTLGDDTLDTIDAIVPPGTDISPPDVSCAPPSLTRTNPRRRPPHDRAAA